MKIITIHITQPQFDRMKILSRKTGLGKAEHIRRALDEYLSKFDLEQEEPRPETAGNGKSSLGGAEPNLEKED
jgi:hypothetical protein